MIGLLGVPAVADPDLGGRTSRRSPAAKARVTTTAWL